MHPPFAANPNMADKVKVAVKLDLEHELGHDHYQTWQSQLDIAFQLHAVDEAKHKYLAAAANLGKSASHYLWQKYPTCPEGDNPYADLISLFDEYFWRSKEQCHSPGRAIRHRPASWRNCPGVPDPPGEGNARLRSDVLCEVGGRDRRGRSPPICSGPALTGRPVESFGTGGNSHPVQGCPNCPVSDTCCCFRSRVSPNLPAILWAKYR